MTARRFDEDYAVDSTELAPRSDGSDTNPHAKTSVREGRLSRLAAFVLTFGFGVAMIANSQGTADGTWFWYAVLFRRGERLYSHLQLALQPFFVLETAWFMALLGKSWLAIRTPAVLHAALLSLAFISIARYSKLSVWQKALLATGAFFMAVASVAYRFDDYHVVAELFVLYSIVLLLKIHEGVSERASLGLAALMGAFAALSFATRVNNGGALFIGSAICLLALMPSRRWLGLALFLAAAGISLFAVVRVTGDSFHDYWMYSITKAAAAKGGQGNILTNPLGLPWHTLQFLNESRHNWIVVVIFLAACALWAFVVRPALPARTRRDFVRAAVGILLILFPFVYMHNRGIRDGSFLLSVATISTFLLYGLGIWALARWVAWEVARRRLSGWNRLEVLFLIPAGQLAAEALSTGSRHGEIYMPMAILCLLLPIASPIHLRFRGRSFLFAAVTLLMCYGFVFRVMEPYRWWSFYSKPMFVGRQWYMHPVYGPMIIERDLLAFLKPVCTDIDGDGGRRELLSLPYSFANYFCDVPPWHDYVQTWYDTSEKSTIDTLMSQLRQAPPKWIFYEREPEVVQFHERVFNGGRPIPHRYLDQFIEEKINRGEWKVVYQSSYASTPEVSQNWLLIQTKQ